MAHQISYHHVTRIEVDKPRTMSSGVETRSMRIYFKGGNYDTVYLMADEPGRALLVVTDETASLYRRIEDMEREVGRLRTALGGELGA